MVACRLAARPGARHDDAVRVSGGEGLLGGRTGDYLHGDHRIAVQQEDGRQIVREIFYGGGFLRVRAREDRREGGGAFHTGWGSAFAGFFDLEAALFGVFQQRGALGVGQRVGLRRCGDRQHEDLNLIVFRVGDGGLRQAGVHIGIAAADGNELIDRRFLS